MNLSELFQGSRSEKSTLKDMMNEWNNRTSLSALSNSWRKVRPIASDVNLSLILFNCQCLNTHTADLDILMSTYTPQICILTGVGSMITNLPKYPSYYWLSQEGSNSYGGVAMLIHESLETKIVERQTNYILIDLNLQPNPILVGAIYVPPDKHFPNNIFDKLNNKLFYVFGDYNAKHKDWLCPVNNPTGIQLKNWLESSGCEMIHPNKPTSKKSEAIIDFAITHDASGWKADTLGEGSSDHYPVLIKSPLTTGKNNFFRKTNWKMFAYFLSCVFPYFNSLVYNLEPDSFFDIFANFLTTTWDRVSEYLPIKKYRPPWPPFLVQLARNLNSTRRKYRRNKSDENLRNYLFTKNLYCEQKAFFLQNKIENKIYQITTGNNIWKYVHPTFHPYAPAFQGLSTLNGKITDHQQIADTLANFYEKHFEKPLIDESNLFHCEAIKNFNDIAELSNISLGNITLNEVELNLNKARVKKSTDSQGLSVFLLKQLPKKYLQIITIAFNKISQKGEVLQASKHAKVICLSKDGLFPKVDKLRPISLLSNIGKIFERIIHTRLLNWCKEKNIYIDEQSGFTEGRRLQTRIVSLTEDLRLTTAANNRPALVVFVDFLSAFDRMWHPALINSLIKLDCPLPLTRWILLWLQNRSMSIHVGEATSRPIHISVGTPQGSVLAATLFRLHIHFLPSFFNNLSCHLFADDLALVITGSLEKKFSINVNDIERKANKAMNTLKIYSTNMILPVNTSKTKALLVHNVVAPPYPKIKFNNCQIEIVDRFKYLGVDITTKLGWGIYIDKRLKKIRTVYNALRIIFRKLPLSQLITRRKLFFAFALPHFIWLFSCWFFFSEIQQSKIEHLYCSGLRITYNLKQWDDQTVYTLAKEYTLKDYLFKHWIKFNNHLDKSSEAYQYQITFNAYLLAKSPKKVWYRAMGLRKNNPFLKRLTCQAKHSKIDLMEFLRIHQKQYGYFKHSSFSLCEFIYKYFLSSIVVVNH